MFATGVKGTDMWNHKRCVHLAMYDIDIIAPKPINWMDTRVVHDEW